MRRLGAFIPAWFSPVIVVWSIVFFAWSFLKTDPNLYFSTHPLLVDLQQSAWRTGENPTTVVGVYLLLIASAFALYLFAVQQKLRFSMLLLVVPLGLLASNVALSHDLFNYMFNAKAVVQYGQDPHLRSALEISPTDDWVRFMHNVHTTAPYGKFWTYLTTVPFVLGLGRFLTTYLSFKVFMGIGVACLAIAQYKLAKIKGMTTTSLEWRWFFFNPLFLIETFSSGHNDVWMMAFVFLSFWLLAKDKRPKLISIAVSLIALLLSTQIKLATVVLIPVWMLLLYVKTGGVNSVPRFNSILSVAARYWADLSACLLLLPLFTSRSQLFHPWYLIWALSFVPFIKIGQLRLLLLLLSLSSMLRYIPFLWVGEYSSLLLTRSQLITWCAVPVWILSVLFIHFRDRLRYNESTS